MRATSQKIVLLIGMCLVLNNSLASDPPVYASLFIGGGIIHNSSKSFNGWRDYYNTNNSELLKRKMSGFRPGFAYTLSANLVIAPRDLGYYYAYRYTRGFTNSQAKFEDGTMRQLRLHKVSHYLPIGLGKFHAKDKADYAGFFFSIPVGFSSYQLESAYIYHDGTRSLGKDKELNGVYRGSEAKIGLDLTMIVRYKRFSFMTNLTYLGTILPSEKDVSALEDKGLRGEWDLYRKLTFGDREVNAKFRELMFNFNLTFHLNK